MVYEASLRGRPTNGTEPRQRSVLTFDLFRQVVCYWRACVAGESNGAGDRTRTCTPLREGDFKSFAYGGLERDYRHTSYKQSNLAGLLEEAVLSLVDDG